MNTLRHYCTDTYSKNQNKFEIRKIQHGCGIITMLKGSTYLLAIEFVMLVILLFHEIEPAVSFSKYFQFYNIIHLKIFQNFKILIIIST